MTATEIRKETESERKLPFNMMNLSGPRLFTCLSLFLLSIHFATGLRELSALLSCRIQNFYRLRKIKLNDKDKKKKRIIEGDRAENRPQIYIEKANYS